MERRKFLASLFAIPVGLVSAELLGNDAGLERKHRRQLFSLDTETDGLVPNYRWGNGLSTLNPDGSVVVNKTYEFQFDRISDDGRFIETYRGVSLLPPQVRRVS